MHTSTFLAAIFAGCALSSPLVKRDLEIDTVYDVVTVTEQVTETAGAASATVAEVTTTAPSTVLAQSFQKNRASWSADWTHTREPSSSVAVASLIVSSADPTSTSLASTSLAPASSSSSVYVASSSDNAATSSAAEVSLFTTLHNFFVQARRARPRDDVKRAPLPASKLSEDSSVPKTLSISSSPTTSTPLTTAMALEARAALPTCNPNNVAVVESQKPHSKAFCSNWRAAGTVHSAPVTVTGLSNKQISNICSCILTGSYVSNTPLKTTSAAAAAATTYQERVIVHHNVHRANHSASALTWSSSLANTAASIAATCVYAHNVTANGGGYGQNIAAGVEANNISAVITDLFYNGEVNNFNGLYGEANPDMSNFENWGHFSQIVWKSTTQVGCATYDCTSSGLANVGQYVSPYFTVCNYSPPGNYGGEYADNIGDSLGHPTVQWNYGL